VVEITVVLVGLSYLIMLYQLKKSLSLNLVMLCSEYNRVALYAYLEVIDKK